jgi:hypothetical protein
MRDRLPFVVFMACYLIACAGLVALIAGKLLQVEVAIP